jgi:8-oxo-dGTP pyrophosphatase MutT (NUDIX family)
MSESNPWKTLGTKHIYTNDWISVREDQVTRPNGTDGIYGVVEARMANAVVALTADNEIYLVGQYRYPTDVYSWEVIAGGGEDNEEPLETAKRELKEEAGIEASEWHELGKNIQMSNCYTSELGTIFLARDLTLGDSAPDDTEELIIKKVTLQGAIKQVESGEITDAFSIMAILLTERWLNKRY